MTFSIQGPEDEFAGVDFGDKRLSKRLVRVVEAVQRKPSAGFPAAMTTAELEGLYRFTHNSKVTPERIAEPHRRATLNRAGGGDIICVQDTTTFSFSTARGGLGGSGGHAFLGHFALALNAAGHPLGVLDVLPWVRPFTPTVATPKRPTTGTNKARTQGVKKKRPSARHVPQKAVQPGFDDSNEQNRWYTMVTRLEDTIGEQGSAIHVMDSEADDYHLLHQLVTNEHRFVIRGAMNRRLDASDLDSQKLLDAVAACPVTCTRDVRLAERRPSRPPMKGKRSAPRASRLACLSIGTTVVNVAKPKHYTRTEYEPSLPINLVCVREDNPPQDCEPVQWFLMTTEPIDTEEQILAVVDIYRSRWKIEEYFKALKTGCAYEKRQFESYPALLNILAVLIPIAWNLLRLRTMARTGSRLPASSVLSEPELTVLRASAEKTLPKNPSLTQAMIAIARMGGHLKRNGDPGWLTLGRGYTILIERVGGYLLAREM